MPKVGHRHANGRVGPEHDPNVCGLLPETSCLTCRAMLERKGKQSILRAELERIRQRFVEADARMLEAGTHGRIGDLEAANRARAEAAADCHALGVDMADTFMMLLRYASLYHPESLKELLERILTPHLEKMLAPLVKQVAELEKRKGK